MTEHRLKFSKKQVMLLIPVIAIIIFAITVSSQGEQNEKSDSLTKNVSVQKITEEAYPVSLSYRGIVQPEETKKYAFALGGKIEKIYVSKGQQIKPGDALVQLDTQSLNDNRSTAAQNVSSLENSARLFKSNLDALKSLYENGALASKEYEAKQTEYQNLLNSLQIAKNGLSQAEEGVRNGTLYADMNGYVMELPFQEGEIAGAGYPVVICKSGGVKVAVGVSTQDYPKINPSSTVLINGRIPGKIESISAFPAEDTMLYAVDISFASTELAVGDTVDAAIEIGDGKGYFVPLESVFNLDGIDYIYSVSKDDSGKYKVNKQQVTLHEIKDERVRVTGLKDGTQVVTDGVKALKENDSVRIVNAERTGAE